MEIRRATLEDAMAIATVHVRSWKAAYPGQIPQGFLDSLHPEDRVEGWLQVLSGTDWPREGVFLLVDAAESTEGGPARAESNAGDGRSGGAVVGFSHICPTRDDDLDPATTGEITSIYLEPEAWGAGKGALLMEASLDEMVAAGYETACLWALDMERSGPSVLRGRRVENRRGLEGPRLGNIHLHRRPLRARPRKQAPRPVENRG